jgi:hypothetical protein
MANSKKLPSSLFLATIALSQAYSRPETGPGLAPSPTTRVPLNSKQAGNQIAFTMKLNSAER